MTGVVLRCPNCGTTQGTLGECDACHEDQVRYFCTNHAPGRWLDGPACAQCGARYGEAAPLHEDRDFPADRPAQAPPVRPPRRRLERVEPDLARDGAGYPDAVERGGRVPNPWLELLAAAARESITRRRAAPLEREAPVPTRGGGCLGRLLLLLMLGIALIVIVPLMLGAFLGLL